MAEMYLAGSHSNDKYVLVLTRDEYQSIEAVACTASLGDDHLPLNEILTPTGIAAIASVVKADS